MILSLFFEFRNKSIVPTIKKLLPNINVYISDKSKSENSPILETNAKLFYTQNEIEQLDSTLIILKELGFQSEDVSYETDEIYKYQIVTGFQETKCQCNNIIQNSIYETITEHRKCIKYLDDRIILEYTGPSSSSIHGIEKMDLEDRNEIINHIDDNVNLLPEVYDALSTGQLEKLIEFRLLGILSFNRSTMSTAARYSQIDIMKWLHKYKCQVFSFSAEGAISKGNIEAIQLLQNWGCKFLTTSGINAAKHNQFEVLQLITSYCSYRPVRVFVELETFKNVDHLQWAMENGYLNGSRDYDKQSDNHLSACRSARYGYLDNLIHLINVNPQLIKIDCYFSNPKRFIGKEYHFYYGIYKLAKLGKQLSVLVWFRNNVLDLGIDANWWTSDFRDELYEDIRILKN